MRDNKLKLYQWIAAGRPPFPHELAKLKKISAKNLRKTLRQANSSEPARTYTRIMDASSDDSTLFLKLINAQRNPERKIMGCQILHQGSLFTEHEDVLRLWTSHFENLSSPMPRPEFDTHFHNFVQQDISIIKHIHNYPEPTDISIDAPMVAKAIKRLKCGKAAAFIPCALNILNIPLILLVG